MRSKNTFPEILLADAFDELNLTYTTHDRALPGTPDIVFAEQRMVVFVHGCYWHRHANCPRATHPKNDQKAWVSRFEEMVRHDQQNIQMLRADGWWVYVAWECDILRRPMTVADDAAQVLGAAEHARRVITSLPWAANGIRGRQAPLPAARCSATDAATPNPNCRFVRRSMRGVTGTASTQGHCPT